MLYSSVLSHFPNFNRQKNIQQDERMVWWKYEKIKKIIMHSLAAIFFVVNLRSICIIHGSVLNLDWANNTSMKASLNLEEKGRLIMNWELDLRKFLSKLLQMHACRKARVVRTISDSSCFFLQIKLTHKKGYTS